MSDKTDAADAQRFSDLLDLDVADLVEARNLMDGMVAAGSPKDPLDAWRQAVDATLRSDTASRSCASAGGAS